MATAEDKKRAIRRLDAFGGSLLTDLFIANKKNGIVEGFRRLALLNGGLAFAYGIVTGMDIATVISQLSTGIFTEIVTSVSTIAIASVYFLVIASLTRVVGWIVDGFFAAK